MSSEYAENGIHRYFHRTKADSVFEFKYSVRRLPERESERSPFVLCTVGVAPVRKLPAESSEQVTQILLGESGDVLEFEGALWIRIRLHSDGYIGWISRNQGIIYPPKEFSSWQKSVKVSPRKNIETLYASRKSDAPPLREFLVASSLPRVRQTSGWSCLLLPDGQTGWIRTSNLVENRGIRRTKESDPVQVGKRFLGISYLWGGRSVKGFDCSGFTQTVFRMCGYELPRDAGLQWLCGEEIEKDFRAMKSSDLVFFSGPEGKITHVGIYTGQKKFMHCSGFVHISSFDKRSPIYDEKYSLSFAGVRRLSVKV